MNGSVTKADIKKIAEISKIIKQSKTFFIAGHVKPDGDSLGSALGLCSMLKRLGKKAAVYCADDIPEILKFMKGADKVKKTAKAADKFDCAIILESINFSRMGDIITPQQAKKIINIDHHTMFTNFGHVNYIVPSSSSTAELILNIFEYMKIQPNKSEAECLYTGILTDTGRFQQINTTADSHIAAAALIKAGVSANNVFKKVYESNSVESLKLLGYSLTNLKTLFNGQFAYMVIRQDIFKQTGAKPEEVEGIINFTMMIKGVKVGCLFKEIDKNTTKISFRSVKSFNVLEIVKRCGGGGHKNAAGCTMNADIDESLKIITGEFKDKLNG